MTEKAKTQTNSKIRPHLFNCTNNTVDLPCEGCRVRLKITRPKDSLARWRQVVKFFCVQCAKSNSRLHDHQNGFLHKHFLPSKSKCRFKKNPWMVNAVLCQYCEILFSPKVKIIRTSTNQIPHDFLNIKSPKCKEKSLKDDSVPKPPEQSLVPKQNPILSQKVGGTPFPAIWQQVNLDFDIMENLKQIPPPKQFE